MYVADFAALLCTSVIKVLPYVIVYRLVDIVFHSVQSAIFKGHLVFKGGK